MTKPEGPPGGPARTLIGRPVQLPPKEGEQPAEPQGPAPLPGVAPVASSPPRSLEQTIPQGSGSQEGLHQALHAALNAGPEKMAAELARARGQSIQQALANAPIPDTEAVAKLVASQPTARGTAPPEVQAVVAAQDAARGHFAGTAQHASPSQYQQPNHAGAYPAAAPDPRDATMYANPNQAQMAAAPAPAPRPSSPTGS